MNSREKGKFTGKPNKFKRTGRIIYVYNANDELLFFTDAEEVLEHQWGKAADGYASASINGERIAAHRFISKPSETEIVDHINRNKKDNRRSNLRNTDKSINAFNSKIREDNTSGIRGVWFRGDTKTWAAEIKKNYKKYSLGCFGSKAEAIAARKAAERILYGD